jgi:hypothetical protein
MLVPDGVYLTEIDPQYFRKPRAPTAAELQILVQTISERIGRHLERAAETLANAAGFSLHAGVATEAQAPTPRHVAMTWVQRLKRVFLIDVTVCEHCGGAVKRLYEYQLNGYAYLEVE